MDEGVLTEAPPEEGAAKAPEEQREADATSTPVQATPEAAGNSAPSPSPAADPQESEGDAGAGADADAGAQVLEEEGAPVLGEMPHSEPLEAGIRPEEPPEDWLEPLEDDDFEDEEDETRSWGQSGSREGSVTGSTAGRGRGRGGRRPRVFIEEEWDECPCLGEGWKRKEVFRRSGCYMGKSDTYYMSPTGVRVRSRVELAKCLSSSVDLDLFDFKSGQFLSGLPPRKRRRRAKESKQSDQRQSQEEEEEEEQEQEQEEQEQLLAEKERLPAKRKRAKNFSDVEKKHLRQLVLSFPAAQKRCYRNSDDTDKTKAWAEIFQHFNQDAETPRTLKQLQFLWQKMRVSGALKVVQSRRGPRARGSALAQLRRREGKRRRRRAQASSTVATTTPPAIGSPPHQHQPLPSVSPSSPLLAQPAPDHSPSALIPAPSQLLLAQPAPPSPAPSPLPFLLNVKQESSETLISNAYTLTDTLTDHTLTHAHTLTHHTQTHPSQAYHPTSAQVAPSNSPQRPLSNSSIGAHRGQNQETSTESSVSGGSGSWSVSMAGQCGRGQGRRGVARGEEPLSLSEQLDLRFHRRRMRFLRQEHELRMRVLQLELSLRQQERDLLLSRTASATNHTPAQSHTTNQSTVQSPRANRSAAQSPRANRSAAQSPRANRSAAQSPRANRSAAQSPRANRSAAQSPRANDGATPCQTANDGAAQGQTTNHSSVVSETANEATVHMKTTNHSRGRRLTANQPPDPAPNPRSPAQQLAKQKQTANALLALIAGGRRSQSRHSSQPDSQSEPRHDPPSRQPYPTKLKRLGNRQPGRKHHAPATSKRRGRVKSV